MDFGEPYLTVNKDLDFAVSTTCMLTEPMIVS